MPTVDLGKIKGADGANGVSQQIRVNSTTTLAAGEDAYVSKNEASTDAEILLDFYIPRGSNAAGDMTKIVYDTKGKNEDIFDYADTKLALTGGTLTGVLEALSPADGSKGVRNILYGDTLSGANGDIFIKRPSSGTKNLTDCAVGDIVKIPEDGVNVDYIYLGLYGGKCLVMRKNVMSQACISTLGTVSSSTATTYTFKKVTETEGASSATSTLLDEDEFSNGECSSITKNPEYQTYTAGTALSGSVEDNFGNEVGNQAEFWIVSGDNKKATLYSYTRGNANWTGTATEYTMAEEDGSSSVAPTAGWDGTIYYYNIQSQTQTITTEVTPTNRYIGSYRDVLCDTIFPMKFPEYVRDLLYPVSVSCAFGDGTNTTANYTRKGFVLSASELGLSVTPAEGSKIAGIETIAAPYIENGSSAVAFGTRTPASGHKVYYTENGGVFAANVNEYKFAVRPCFAISTSATLNGSNEFSDPNTGIFVKINGGWVKIL